jgi:hypothetical protein
MQGERTLGTLGGHESARRESHRGRGQAFNVTGTKSQGEDHYAGGARADGAHRDLGKILQHSQQYWTSKNRAHGSHGEVTQDSLCGILSLQQPLHNIPARLPMSSYIC